MKIEFSTHEKGNKECSHHDDDDDVKVKLPVKKSIFWMSFWVVDYIQGGFIDAFIGKCDLIKSAIIIVSICQEQISCRSLSSSSVFPIFQVIVLLECSDLGFDLGSDQIRAYVC